MNLGGRMMPGQRVTEEFGFRRYLVVSTLLMAATLVAAPFVSAAALPSGVTDPGGDAMRTPGSVGPSYLDIAKASLPLSHGQLVFVMDLAAPQPNTPPPLP